MLVAMAFAIPTMYAQESTLYVAKTASKGYFANVTAAAGDPSLTYNASTGAYEGVVSLPQGYAFAFYTGSVSSPTYYGSKASGTAGSTAINFYTANPYTATISGGLVVNGRGGWYISRWADNTTTARDGDVKMSVNLTSGEVSFEESDSSYQENLYILQDANSLFTNYATMPLTDEATGEYSVTLNDVPAGFRFIISIDPESYSNAFCKAETISLGSGKTGTYDLIMTSGMNNNNSLIVENAGDYTLSFNYDSKVLTVNNITKPIYKIALFNGTTATSARVEPYGGGEPQLVYNPETGYYEGELTTLKSMTVKFYTEDGEDVTYWGWTNKQTGANINAAVSLATADTGTYPTTAYASVAQFTSNSDYTKVGSFNISYFAATTDKINTAGTVKIQLNTEKGEAYITKLDAFQPRPTEMYMKGGYHEITSSSYAPTITTLAPSDSSDEVFQTMYEVPSTCSASNPLYFIFFNVDNVSTSLIYAPETTKGNPIDVTFTNGMYKTDAKIYQNTDPYWDNLSYKLTQPGKYFISLNYKTGALTIAQVGEAPEKIGVAMASSFAMAPAPAASDVFLMPTPEDPNIYKGVVNFKKNAAFGFYVGTPGSADYTLYRAHGWASISCSQYNYWPVDEEEAAQAVLEPGSTMGNWYFSTFSNTSVNAADYTVEINWLTKTFRIFEEEIVIPTPEKLYIYASVDGGQNYLQVEEMTNPENGVFSVKYNIPEVPTFVISDPDFSPADGDPDHGWRFYIYKPADEISGNTILGAELGAQVLEFVGDAPAVRTLVTSGTGMFVLEPGVATISYNWATNELQVTKPEIDESLKDVIYYLHADNYFNGPWVPNPETDPQLTYDPVSQTYVLDEPILVNKTGGFRFYRQNVSGTITYITPMMATQIQIGSDYTWKQSFELRNTSAWRFLTFHDPEAREAEVTLTVDLVNTTLAVTQVSKDKNPEQIYIWYVDGTLDVMGTGYTYKCLTANPLKPIEEGGAVYTTTWDVPEVTDLEFMDKGAPDHGAFFYLSTSTSKSGGTLYRGYYGNAEGVYGPTIEFTANKKEVSLPVLTGGETASFVIVTPGKSQLTLDLDKAILTVEYLEDIVPEPEDNVITLNFSGVELDDLSSALQVLDAMNDGETLLINENPFDYVYTQGVFLMFVPQDGYDVAVKCSTNDADEVDGTYSINVGAAPMDDDEDEATAGDAVTLMAYPAANGLTFNVVLSEHQTSGINALYDLGNGELRVFNLQGVQVLRTQNASELNILEPGLYIINGKKVVVRK